MIRHELLTDRGGTHCSILLSFLCSLRTPACSRSQILNHSVVQTLPSARMHFLYSPSTAQSPCRVRISSAHDQALASVLGIIIIIIIIIIARVKTGHSLNSLMSSYATKPSARSRGRNSCPPGPQRSRSPSPAPPPPPPSPEPPSPPPPSPSSPPPSPPP